MVTKQREAAPSPISAGSEEDVWPVPKRSISDVEHVQQCLAVAGWPAFKNKDINPYNWLLYTHMVEEQTTVTEFAPRQAIRQRPDILHMHWPESFLSHTHPVMMPLKLGVLMIGLVALKASGVKIAWTMHNLQPHERRYPRLQRWYWRWFLRRMDGTIALTETGADLALRRFPELRNKPMAVIPHGHYMDVYPRQIDRSTARRRLGLSTDDRVVLFVGQIRPYKGVPNLVEQFTLLPDENARLLIAGRPQSTVLRQEVEQAATGDQRIQLHLDHIPDADLQVFLHAADLVVLPYHEVLNSGTAILALSFLTPVLVPARGAMAELQLRFGAAVVSTYQGTLTVEDLSRSLSTSRIDRVDRAALEQSVGEQLGWHTIANQTSSFFRQLAR